MPQEPQITDLVTERMNLIGHPKGDRLLLGKAGRCVETCKHVLMCQRQRIMYA